MTVILLVVGLRLRLIRRGFCCRDKRDKLAVYSFSVSLTREVLYKWLGPGSWGHAEEALRHIFRQPDSEHLAPMIRDFYCQMTHSNLPLFLPEKGHNITFLPFCLGT